jgi:cell division protein FtsB
LFNPDDKNIFYAGDNNTLTNLLCVNSPIDSTKLQHELEKFQLIVDQKDREIEYLKQQNLDLRKMIELLESKPT